MYNVWLFDSLSFKTWATCKLSYDKDGALLDKKPIPEFCRIEVLVDKGVTTREPTNDEMKKIMGWLIRDM